MRNYQKLRNKRLEKEKKCGRGVFDSKNNTLYIENIPYIFQIFTKILKNTGIYEILKRKALEVRINHESWYFRDLPSEFEDFRILHISDMHIDSLPELSEILPPMIDASACDMVVFTGDFRFNVHCSEVKITHLLEPIVEASVRKGYGAYAILGNHDYLDYSLENVARNGLKLLVNETLKIRKNDSEISFVALDDPHFYRTGRLFDFRDVLREGVFNILLAHSPELYREASLYNIDFYLCGHTHGGQLCLPGGIPVLTNCRTPRKFVKGRWKFKGLEGYTSNGAGASGLPIRWNCPPEITVHHLLKKR